MSFPSWTISELRVRYELEPTLDDMFVEGQFDKDIIMTAYRHLEIRGRTIYTIDSVDVDSSVLFSHGLTSGNKQRLIALCRELADVNEKESARFLVDRDTDHWFGELEDCRGLVWTEYCDIESYFFKEDRVRDVILDAGSASVAKWDAFYASFIWALKWLFALRVASRDLRTPLNHVKYEKLMTIDSCVVRFDSDEYLKRTLQNSGAAAKGGEFAENIAKWLEQFTDDPRGCSRGHDFVQMLSWAISRLRGEKVVDERVVPRMLILLVPKELESLRALV